MYYLIYLCIFIMLNICNYYSICGTLNFVGTPEKLTQIVDHLKSNFEMKDIGKEFFFSSAYRSSTFQTKHWFISQHIQRKS